MKNNTLISEIPFTRSGIILYIKSLSELVADHKKPAPEGLKDVYRQRKYLLGKARKRLEIIDEQSS